MREVSLKVKTSFPTVMRVILVEGRCAWTFLLTQASALFGSSFLDRYSFPRPMMNSMVVLAKALRTGGSASQSLSFVAPIDQTSGMKCSGDGRFFAI